MRTAAFVALDVVLVLAVSRVLRGVLARAGQPPVMAEVLAGLVLGASVLGALPGEPTAALFPADARGVLAVLGQIGVVAYLFGVGARLELRGRPAERRAVGAVAAGSFAVPWVAGAGLAVAVHGGVAGNPPLLPFALFLGTAFAVTAFPVLARIVEARGLTDRPAGRVALGAAAGQELLVWPALAAALALAGTGGRSVPAVLGLGAVAIALVIGRARVVPPRGLAVLAGLAAAAVATETAGLHLVLGAFLYGAALPAPQRAAGVALLRTRPATLTSAALLPLFFALPALRVDATALGTSGLGLLAVVLAVAVAAKLASASGAAALAGMPRRDALTVGALMNARGLVELVVLSVGLDAGLIDARLFAVMVLMALATTFLTGPLVTRIGRLREDGDHGTAARRDGGPGARRASPRAGAAGA
ncbi:MAG TPA: cation:proton antiporter [Solirubrobacteraceae bacterium]